MTLKTQITSDISTFFNTDEFADSASYTPAQYAHVHKLGTSNTTTVNGNLYKDFVVINGSEAYLPIFECATADVSSAAHGDRLTIDSVDYKVVGIEPDGTGITKLAMEVL